MRSEGMGLGRMQCCGERYGIFFSSFFLPFFGDGGIGDWGYEMAYGESMERIRIFFRGPASHGQGKEKGKGENNGGGEGEGEGKVGQTNVINHLPEPS